MAVEKITKVRSRKSTRSTAITIRLDPKILKGLTELGEKLGIAQATLAGLAISEYVVKGQAAYSATEIMQKACGEELARTIGAPMAALLEGMKREDFIQLVKGMDDD